MVSDAVTVRAAERIALVPVPEASLDRAVRARRRFVDRRQSDSQK
jgi:hypothetical protein